MLPKRHLFLYLYILLFLISFTLSQQKQDIKEVVLHSNEDNLPLVFPYVKSTIYNIKGEIDKTKKYILISSNYDSSEPNSYGSSAYFFISKKEEFDPLTDEYDFTSIEETRNKIAIPQAYFTEGLSTGFYLNITCLNECHNLYVNFSFVDEINLSIGEKFSYLFSEKVKSDSFINLAVTNKNEFSNLGENLVFFLTGGGESQVSMEVDDNFVTTKFTNVFAYIKKNVGMETSKVKIELVNDNERNIKITFKTETFIDSEHNKEKETERTLYEGDYNQYFIINENINECFTIKKSEDNPSFNMHELFIVSQKEMTAQITDEEENKSSLQLKSLNPFNNMGFEQLFPNLISKICFNTKKNVKQAILGLFIRRRSENENSYNAAKNANPLIDQTLFVSNRLPSKMVSVYSHEHFFSHNEENKDLTGINMGINVINGKIKVYKTLCKTFPYCSYSLENITDLISKEKFDSDFQTIVPINNYYSISLGADSDFYSLSNKQYLILVTCTPNEKSEKTEQEDVRCLYTVNFYPMNENKFLSGGDKVTKFISGYKKVKGKEIRKEDSYSIALHQNKKLVVELIVYSGDVFIVPSVVPEKCYFDEHHLGSNERRIFHCDSDFEIQDYIRYNFKVRASDEGGVYTIFVSEKEPDNMDDMFPLEMTTMESIHGESRNLLIDGGKYLALFESEENKIFTTLFNTINCDLRVTNKNNGKEYFSTENNGFIIDYTSTDDLGSDQVSFSIKKTDSTHADEKNCLFYVSSNYLLNKESYMFIPESKPFRFKLNKDFKIIRTSFLFSPIDTNPRVYLRVVLFSEIAIKLKIKVGYSEEIEYILFQSKDILVVDGRITGLRLNSINQIKIVAELYNQEKENEEAIVDLNIKTKYNIPYSIKTEEYFSDMVNKNNTQYYISMISTGSRGDILVNFKYGTGAIYGKLYSYHEPKSIGGWNNRIILPDESSKNLLKFDYYEQKLIISQEDTEFCEDYCYLIFGVKTKDDYLYAEEFISSYSIYYRYANIDEYNNFFISLPNNEFISSSIRNEQNDYFKYIFYSEDELVLIDFKSEYCSLTIGVNTPRFENEERIFVFYSDGKNKIIKITKSEILSKAGKDFDTGESYKNIKGIALYIRIGKKFEKNENLKKIDIDKLDMKYKLRVNTPNKVMQKIINVDTNHPTYCENSLSPETIDGKEYYYCDYLLKLDAYDFFSNIEIVGISTNHEELSVYCNIINSNDFTTNITQGILPNWPTINTHQFPQKGNEAKNFLKLTFYDFPLEEDKYVDPRLLIRVYSASKSSMELFTSMVSPTEGIIPFSKEYQLFSADSLKGIKIRIPDDHSYNVHIITIMGEGDLMLTNNEGMIFTNGGKNFSLYGDYNSMTINTKENEEMNFYIKAVEDEQKKKQKEEGNIDDTNFRFYLWYTKNLFDNNIEKISLGSSSNFIQRRKNSPPLGYYLKLSTDGDNIKDLPFTIDFNSLLSYQGTQGDSRDENVTELFDIKGYLITEEELIKLQAGNTFYKEIIENRNLFLGNYDYSLHQGNVLIRSDKINNFIEENKNISNEKDNSIYAFITVDNSKINRRQYYYLGGTITSFGPNEIKRSTPSNTYITNLFYKGNYKHIYKLDGLSSTDEEFNKMKIEFASKNKNLKMKFIKSPEDNTDQTNYFEAKKIIEIKNYGKDVYIINKHLSEVYLLIECNEEINEDNKFIEYTFKYSATKKSTYDYKYNNKILYERFTDSTNKINIAIDKVKTEKDSKNVLANYYIRVFEIEKSVKDKEYENSISFTLLTPYLINKVSYDDEILIGDKNIKKSNFNIDIFVKTEKHFYVDVIAEIVSQAEGEFVGYKSFYPEITEKIEKENKFDKNTVYIVIAISCILVVCAIALIAVTIIYRNKNKDLERKVEEISFKISREDSEGKINDIGENEDNLLN